MSAKLGFVRRASEEGVSLAQPPRRSRAVNNPIYRSVTLAGDTSIGGVGRYDINGGTVDGAGTTFNGGTFTLTKDGAGKLSLTGVNTHTGGTSVIGGILNINADAALGATGNAVTSSNAATLQAGGPVTSARAFTLGSGGGKIDTAGLTVTLNASSSLAGTSLEKTGAGVLNISGTQTYAALTTSGCATNLYTPLGTGSSTVAANAAVSFYARQTLASLTIADGVEVTFGDGLPFASVPEKDGAFGGVATVPEPGSLALLLSASRSLLARRRRQPQSLPLPL